MIAKDENTNRYKTVLITGTSQGLGKELSRTFSEHGYYVYSVCNNENGVLFGPGKKIIADISVEEDVRRSFRDIEHLDALVNNARFTPTKSPDHCMSEGEWWDRNIDVSLKGTYLCCMEAFEIMKKQETGGCIINVSSVRGIVANEFDRIPYGVAKAGQIGLTKSFAVAGGPYNIRVNSLLPGAIETENLKKRITPERYAKVCGDILLNRMGTMAETCHAALFLVENTYMTGASLNCSGGLLLDY